MRGWKLRKKTFINSEFSHTNFKRQLVADLFTESECDFEQYQCTCPIRGLPEELVINIFIDKPSSNGG